MDTHRVVRGLVWCGAAALLAGACWTAGPVFGQGPGDEARAYFETAPAVSELRIVIAPEDV